MAKIIKRKDHWYLIDASLPNKPLEGSAVMHGDSTPAFARFIDYTEKICYLSGGIGEVSFDEFDIIVASTNPLDGTPMLNTEMIENQLLNNFIFDTIGKDNFGVLYPDENDSVLGYFPTHEECIAALKDWFSHKPFPILVRDMYFATYTIRIPKEVPEPYIIDGFVNILKVNIKAE